MKYPQLKFENDRKFDAWKIKNYLHREKRGDNFKKRIYAMHPELKNTEDIGKYVNEVYKNNLNRFNKEQKKIYTEWKKVEKEFFSMNNKIYKGLAWPKGKYIGYLSISQPYPRFLDTTIFQVDAFDSKNSVIITAHEMGHFIFFEYVRNRYAPDLKKLDERKLNKIMYNKFKIPLWELSEVHVVILMRNKQFMKLIPNQSIPYTSQEKFYKLCSKLWKDSVGNIDKFFDLVEK